MSMKVNRELTMLHPVLKDCWGRIKKEIIEVHNAPFRLFETGREHDRQQGLLSKGRTRDLLSRHLYNLENDPPLYTTAIDIIYYDGKWSWNLRDQSIVSWYILFGNLVLDKCPELEWRGRDRKYCNYGHFQLRRDVLISNLDKYPCVCP